ncbi:MAG: FAD-binding protein, partial [Myxococcota bacterium]
WGATALSSGAVDLAGASDERPGDPWRGRPAAARNLGEMLRRNPRHPLGTLVARVPEALAAFARAVPIYASRPLDAPNLVLPTDLGTWKSTFMAQRSQVDADLVALDGKRVAVVGLRGWPIFRAAFVAASLEELARRGGVSVSMVPVEIEAGDADLPLREPHELARLVEQGAALADALRRAATGFDLVLAPPVLGLDRDARDLGLPLCEPLASDQPVPGLRLQRALDRAVVAAGVEVRAGDAAVDGCDATVLASGRFLGGGIVREAGRFREPLFDAPVCVDGAPDEGAWLGLHAGAHAVGPHAFLSAGVRVDERLRPLRADGTPVRDSLFAAGAVIGGWDAVAERCGMGTAIVTGFFAGLAAAGAD